MDCPSLFLNGFEYVQSDLPKVDSHAPFTIVRPATHPMRTKTTPVCQNGVPTFDIHARCADNLEINDILGRGLVCEDRRRVDEHVLVGNA